MSKKYYGYMGKILKVNLTNKTTQVLTLNQEIIKKYIGGKGLAGYYIREYIHLPWDDPEMPMMLFTGPLVGTSSPTSGRMVFLSKSPQTGTIGDASVGGKLGGSIKKAGFDGIIITGKSDKICGIEIDEDKIVFKNATHLKTMLISETLPHLKGKGANAQIGPAAFNDVRFSSIAVDGHYFAGRNGLGLSFAAKNLKYITVKGKQKCLIHDSEALKSAREDIFRLTSASPILMGELGITNYGTGALYDLMANRKMMPTDNFKKTFFDGFEKMNAHAYKKKYSSKKNGCQGCHILCKKTNKQNGMALPEFETMSHFSALIQNKDLNIVTKANELCNEWGIDTISAGATLACYLEINNKKISSEQILELLEKICKGIEEGAELKLGSYEYAKLKGKKELSMSVKKLELPAYDPRGAYGMALAYTTSTRGGCHLRAYPIGHEILRKPVSTDRFTFTGKARIIKFSEDLNAIIDSLTVCKFIFFAATLEEYSKVFTAVTGIPIKAQELLDIGERIYYHERMMNCSNGFKDIHDDLPKRFFEEDGTEVKKIDRNDFLKARSNYYKVRGLTQEGTPLKEKCKQLGLEWNNS